MASPGDKFVTVMSGFISVATYNFQEVEELHKEMKQNVRIKRKTSIEAVCFSYFFQTYSVICFFGPVAFPKLFVELMRNVVLPF